MRNLRSIKQNSITVYALFDEFMVKQEEKRKVGLITQAVYVKYRCTIRYCKEAMQTNKMLSDLTTSDMEDIYTYMLQRVANNSAICYMRKHSTIQPKYPKSIAERWSNSIWSKGRLYVE